MSTTEGTYCSKNGECVLWGKLTCPFYSTGKVYSECSAFRSTSITKYRKKPVVIEAIQFTGTDENIKNIQTFAPGIVLCNLKWRGLYFLIETLEGNHRADIGDWIIKGVKGEFYPCKPDIFEMTYDEV